MGESLIIAEILGVVPLKEKKEEGVAVDKRVDSDESEKNAQSAEDLGSDWHTSTGW